MKNFLNKIKLFALAHKIISVIILVIIIFIGHWGYKKLTSTSGDPRYITAQVAKGTIISTISGTGQVSASSQVDVKPEVSGNVVALVAQNGQKLGKGALIAELDSKDAQKAVRDAELSLEAANLSLEKLKIQNSEENINADLAKAYDDGFNTISNVFLDLPTTLAGLENILGSKDLSEDVVRASGKTAQAYRSASEVAYYAAKDAFEKDQGDFRLLDHNSKPEEIENVIDETYQTTKLASDAINDFSNLIDYLVQRNGQSSNLTSFKASLSSYSSSTNSNSSSLLSVQTSIKNSKDTLPNADLDLKSSELSVEQKQNALQDAKDKLADYYIRAPFSGTITAITIKKGDSANSGTAIGTLITDQQLAVISFNEIDVAKIKVGQKATLTFDAVPDLTISGVVAEIDSIGTASQGVVTYDVKISFDTQDDRVKPSMSVSAAIITDMKQDVLVVPNSAIKSQGGTSYVEKFDAPLAPSTDGLIGTISKIIPTKIPVEVGLSNDSETEITSGLQEGEEIITRTILPTTGTPSAAAPSLFGGSGGATRGTAPRGNVRIGG